MWDIEVEEDNSYVAHGLIHHNSKGPNLQNIPARTQLGAEVRAAFIAGPGKVLLSRDLSQIELRVLAHEADEPSMIDIFKRDGDIHVETTLRAYNLTWEDWKFMASGPCDCGHVGAAHDPKEGYCTVCGVAVCHKHSGKKKQAKLRTPIKNTNFGIVYGLTGLGLQQQLASQSGIYWSEQEADDFIDLWFSLYPGVRDYMMRIYQMARRYGLVWDAVGRIRLVPGVRSVHSYVQSAALRESGNMPVQSFAAAILKIAMARCEDETGPVFRDAGIYVEPLLQIHDEILFEVDEDYVECVAEYMGHIMDSAVQLKVPLKSEAGWGKRWEK